MEGGHHLPMVAGWIELVRQIFSVNKRIYRKKKDL